MSLNPGHGEVYLMQHCDNVCNCFFFPDIQISSTNKTPLRYTLDIVEKIFKNKLNSIKIEFVTKAGTVSKITIRLTDFH